VRGLALLAAALLVACAEPPDEPVPVPLAVPRVEYRVAGDWPSYNRDLGGTRYSPLGQIDTGNVAELRPAWSYPLGPLRGASARSAGSQLTPVVVAGVLYAAAADRVVALHADTGNELWRYTLDQDMPSQRGMAYRFGEGTGSGRVYFTAGRRLIALGAETGEPVAVFGRFGEVEMPAAYDAAPVSFENLLIVGSASAPGGVRAFDARSGTLVWVFNMNVQRAERDDDSADNDARRESSAPARTAPTFTLDVDRGLLYAVLQGPGPDEDFGGNRPGDNRPANSIVAIDARTGQRRWEFQTVHHDLWGYDLPAAPVLLDATVGGTRVPVLALAAKTGYLYLLNRVTGEPLFGIAETPMPKSNVPGEQSSATQPIPVKPRPIARVSYVAEDLVRAIDTTEEHARFCRELIERSGGLQNLGPFTPFRYRAPGAAAQSTIVFPGASGGAGWGGAAADPALGFVFVNTMDEGTIGWIEPNAADSEGVQSGGGPGRDGVPYRRRSAVGGPVARFWWSDAAADSSGNLPAWPCQRPPWGQLVAVNVANGEIAWQVPLGLTEGLPEGRQRTGRPNAGGPIATAGGLVFIAASDDRRFRAFDSRTGEQLWETVMPLSAQAVPVTYLGGNGKQFVAIVAGATPAGDVEPAGSETLIAYSLP
jgi:glucose dehydrogenase